MITKKPKYISSTFFDILDKNEKTGIHIIEYTTDFLLDRFINGSQTEFQNNKD